MQDKYIVTIETQTDTLMGSGQSAPGVIDIDVRYDDYGLPYMNAKTFKGHLREQMELIQKLQPARFGNISVSALLGSPDTEGVKKNGKLSFSRVHVSNGIEYEIKNAVRENRVTKEEVLDSLTALYALTSLDEERIAQDHTLRYVRMIRKGLIFTTELYGEDLTDPEEKFLERAIEAIQHIGTYKTKGKGLVRCTCDKMQIGEAF